MGTHGYDYNRLLSKVYSVNNKSLRRFETLILLVKSKYAGVVIDFAKFLYVCISINNIDVKHYEIINR